MSCLPLKFPELVNQTLSLSCADREQPIGLLRPGSIAANAAESDEIAGLCFDTPRLACCCLQGRGLGAALRERLLLGSRRPSALLC